MCKRWLLHNVDLLGAWALLCWDEAASRACWFDAIPCRTLKSTIPTTAAGPERREALACQMTSLAPRHTILFQVREMLF